MAHSIKAQTIEDEIIDALDFLIDNRKIIISDLKKEFNLKIKNGRTLHKGFKLQAFEKNLKSMLRSRVRDMYTFEKRWYLSTESAMLIESDLLIKAWTSKIIKEVLDE
jgi:hypothetical protein